MEVGNMISALRYGFALRNPEFWNHTAEAGRAVSGLLLVGVAIARGYGIDLHADDTTLGAIGAGIVGVVSLFKSYTTVATSPDLGVRSASGTNPA